MDVVIKDIEKIVKTQQVKPIHKIRQRPENLRTFAWEQSCVEIDTSVVSALTDNSNEVFKNAVDVLLKLMNNILKDPYSIKYRRIRLSNAKIESMLLGQCYISIKI